MDDLHERAGSTRVMHLHGEILKVRSERNFYKTYPITKDIKIGDIAEDGGQMRPHIVWFEEPVPMIEHAIPLMEAADVFVLIGSSLAVYPAAGLMNYLDHGINKYVIDKVIPPVEMYKNIKAIPKSATEGMEELVNILLG